MICRFHVKLGEGKGRFSSSMFFLEDGHVYGVELNPPPDSEEMGHMKSPSFPLAQQWIHPVEVKQAKAQLKLKKLGR